MNLFNKLKWILGILLVIVLIIATNLIDRNNFIRVKDSMVTIYEDRLVADELIFELSDLIHEKEIAVLTSDSQFFMHANNKVNAEIKNYITKFGKTKLIEEESEEFYQLKTNLEQLKKAENEMVQSNFVQKNSVLEELKSTKKNLRILSKIQLNEGGQQWSICKKAIESIELFTQMEIYLLAFLAIIIQIIILYSPSEKDELEDE